MRHQNRTFVFLVSITLVAAMLLPGYPATAQSPSVWTVTNTNDSGTGSLRWAITEANASAGSDQINFNITSPALSGGYWSIALASSLPALSGGNITIDGLTQPGGRTDGGPKIELEGHTNALQGTGVLIKSSGNVVRGLIMNGFEYKFAGEPTGVGVAISGYNMPSGVSGNRVESCYIGTDYAGNLKVVQGAGGDTEVRNARDAVAIVGRATGNVITGNVLSGNRRHGVYIGQGSIFEDLAIASGNTVSNNTIGVNAAGTQALANFSHGVLLSENANNNTIGPGNIISGNGFTGDTPEYGVRVSGEVSAGGGGRISGNQIIGNRIGTDSAGTAAIPNGDGGVNVRATSGTVVGGSEANRNIISGNAGPGLVVDNFDGGMASITISYNWIGLQASGTQPLKNERAGVRLECEATGVTVGPGNVIGGHQPEAGFGSGVWVTSLCTGVGTQKTSNGNLITGNSIGTNVDNSGYVPNRYGVELSHGVTSNRVENNLIRGNERHGVLIWVGSGSGNQAGSPPDDNLVKGNTVQDNGQAVGGNGVLIQDNAVRNRVTETSTTRNGNVFVPEEGRGINLVNGGNNELAAPTMSGVTVSGVTPNLTLSGNLSGGMNCGSNSCQVEVFDSDTAENFEGPNYLSSFASSGSGTFSLNLAGCQPYLTFTITDQSGNTSPFTQAFGPFSACTAAAPRYGVSWNPASSSLTLPTDSSTINHEHRLRNDGNQADTFDLSVTTAPAGVNVTLSPTGPVTLNPGEERTISVGVTVSGSVTTSPVVTRVTATSQGDGSKSAVATQNTTIQLAPRPQLSPATLSDSAKPGEPLVYSFTLENVGNGRGDFSLAASGLPADWNVSVSPAQTTLDPGGTGQVQVSVTPPAGASADAAPVEGTLTATATGGNATARFTTAVELVPQLSLTPGTQTIQAGRGQTVPFTHTLTNLANGTDTFSVTVSPPAGWSYSVEPAGPIQLGANAATIITVTYDVPTGVAFQSYTAQVTARSAADTSVNKQVENIIDVVSTSVPRFDAPLTRAIDPGEVVTLTHTLSNVGDANDDFDLALDVPSGLDLQSLSPASPVSLDIGASVPVTVVLRAPALALAGDYAVSLRATAQGGIRAQARVVDTVTVNQVPDLALTAPSGTTERAGRVISYTFSLANDGNFDDQVSLEPGSSQGWDVATPGIPSGSLLVPARTSADVLVTVTIPQGAPVDLVHTTTLTATSSLPGEQDSASVDTTVAPTPDVSLGPPLITQVALDTEPVTFTFTLTNTGNVVQDYDLTALNVPDGWTSTLEPKTVLALDIGAAVTVTLGLQAPAEASRADVDVTVKATASADATVFAEAVARLSVGAPYDVLITPDRSDAQRPGEAVVYTHRITNTGRFSDTFSLFTRSTLGWESLVVPSSIFLEPDASATVTVTVLVPPAAGAGITDITTVLAESDGDPEVVGEVRDTTTALQVGGVSFAPSSARLLVPGAEVVFQHTLINIGNGFDTFTMTATQDLDWPVTLVPEKSPSLRRGQIYAVEVRVQVPSSASLSEINRIRVRATSTFDPQVYEELVDTVSQNVGRVEQVGVLYLPMILRQ